MLASRSDEEEIVKLLLDYGVDIKAKDFEGATALHLAAEEGADTCARALLKAGGDINSQMNNGDTPVMCAARRCKASQMVTSLNYFLFPPLHYSIYKQFT